VERSAQPEQSGQPLVVGMDTHRQVAVIPVAGGVEIIAFIDAAPEELTCHRSCA
jgi:hypothetical protein